MRSRPFPRGPGCSCCASCAAAPSGEGAIEEGPGPFHRRQAAVDEDGVDARVGPCIRGSVTLLESARIAAKNYTKALQSLRAIRDYVNQEEVVTLPGIARRRDVDTSSLLAAANQAAEIVSMKKEIAAFIGGNIDHDAWTARGVWSCCARGLMRFKPPGREGRPGKAAGGAAGGEGRYFPRVSRPAAGME
jgi:hypothetical protein